MLLLALALQMTRLNLDNYLTQASCASVVALCALLVVLHLQVFRALNK